MFKRILLTALISLPLMACAKTAPVLKSHENFIGTWTNPNSQFIVSENGYMSYQTSIQTENKTDQVQEKTTTASNVQAPITRMSYTEIEVGNGVFNSNFKVNKPPYLVKGKWHMTLNDQDYIKK